MQCLCDTVDAHHQHARVCVLQRRVVCAGAHEHGHQIDARRTCKLFCHTRRHVSVARVIRITWYIRCHAMCLSIHLYPSGREIEGTNRENTLKKTQNDVQKNRNSRPSSRKKTMFCSMAPKHVSSLLRFIKTVKDMQHDSLCTVVIYHLVLYVPGRDGRNPLDTRGPHRQGPGSSRRLWYALRRVVWVEHRCRCSLLFFDDLRSAKLGT